MSNPGLESNGVELRPLPGSEPRSASRAIQASSPVPVDTTIAITLVLRRRGELPDPAAAARAHVDFPASSPHALACGGTRLDADPTTGQVHAETVWNNGAGHGATGGGVSDVFGEPSWQVGAGAPSGRGKSGRGVPDVAAVADPQTGYQVRVDGTDIVVGGTSAVAPLWAALVTRLAQAANRPLGQLAPVLYQSAPSGTAAPGFRDITVGNNGAYSTGPGWDPCTGLGVPDGTALLTALSQHRGSTT